MKPRTIAFLFAGFTFATALFLLLDRGGVIAWSTAILAITLLLKILIKPTKVDLRLSVALPTLAALTWAGTLYYVISTYESGEVVELVIATHDGPHTARLWVFEMGADTIVYYDAEPDVAKALLAGKPLQFTRGGEISTRIPKTTPVDALSDDEANQVLEAMGTKYGNRMRAADIYYVLLGGSRDRVAVIATLLLERV